MKIMLLGANGQVGWELQRALSPLGQLSAFDRRQADLTDHDLLQKIIDTVRPDVIVNAAAYTAVDLAEQESALAHKINADAVGFLANSARELDAWLIHYSTDYVFDGNAKGKYFETDVANPQSVYGQSKLAGEQAIIESGCRHLILRTSWVFASRGNNFAKTMLKLAQEKDELSVVADQMGAPTSAELIADITTLALLKLSNALSLPMSETNASNFDNNAPSGIYHLTASGHTSWYEFAKYVITFAEKSGMKLKVKSGNIKPITTQQFPRPAKRPLNSRLDTQKLQRFLGINIPDWRFHAERMLTEYLETQS